MASSKSWINHANQGPCRIVSHREKACTSPFSGAGGLACGALMEQETRWTSSVLVIEQSLYTWAPWWAWRPKLEYGQSKLPGSEKTCTSPFSGAGSSACRMPMEDETRGTSSVLIIIELALHMWAPWRTWRPRYCPVKVACLKRENAVLDTQIVDIGTQQDN